MPAFVGRRAALERDRVVTLAQPHVIGLRPPCGGAIFTTWSTAGAQQLKKPNAPDSICR